VRRRFFSAVSNHEAHAGFLHLISSFETRARARSSG